jgi:hypothetical protein
MNLRVQRRVRVEPDRTAWTTKARPRRAATSVLATLVAGVLLPLVALPARAAPPSTAAWYSRAALSQDELAMVPEALGKVTRAGKVAGKIDAAVGDIVMPASASAPDAYAGPALHSGRTPEAGTPTAAAATVLHADKLAVIGTSPGPSGLPARLRLLLAMQENTSKEARGYFRARLVYGLAGTDVTWPTYHQLHFFRVHRSDTDNSEADGCGDARLLEHCTWTKDPADCRGPNPPCDAYQVVGTYRPKGNNPDLWLTEVYDYTFWHPADNQWIDILQCPPGPPPGPWVQGYWWRVGDNAELVPTRCPWPEGR